MPNVFVTLINYNGEKDTLDCLESLDKLLIKDFNLNVIIVDNASKEKFEVKDTYKNFKPEVIRSEQNLGFSGGHNLAIKKALKLGADYVVILNNDVLVGSDLVVNLLKTFKQYEACGIVSPKIYFAKGHEFHKDRYKEENLGKVIWYAGGKMDWNNVLASHIGVDEVDNGQFEKQQQTDFASGCCMMIKRQVFEKTGVFDENYFLYFEDNDLCQRAKQKKFEIYFEPSAKLWHLNAGSVGGSGSMMQDYYISRNRLYFGFKFAPIRSQLAIFRESFKLLMVGRKWQKIGVKDYYLRKFGKGSFI